MSYVLAVLQSADAEAAEACRWYNEQRPGLGAEFTLALEAMFEAIRRTPFLYPQVKGEIRRAVMRRFPFNIFYVVRGERIYVIAISHGSRHPRTWQERHP
jgi:plasmid stabilization system protein ParE